MTTATEAKQSVPGSGTIDALNVPAFCPVKEETESAVVLKPGGIVMPEKLIDRLASEKVIPDPGTVNVTVSWGTDAFRDAEPPPVLPENTPVGPNVAMRKAGLPGPATPGFTVNWIVPE
jgi:hypothetical protein